MDLWKYSLSIRPVLTFHSPVEASLVLSRQPPAHSHSLGSQNVISSVAIHPALGPRRGKLSGAPQLSEKETEGQRGVAAPTQHRS